MKNLIITLILILAMKPLFAQHAHFTSSGTIEYEKTANMYALLTKAMEDDDSWGKMFFEAYQKANPQFKRQKSTLTFGDNKTLYKPVPNDDVSRKMGDELVEQINTVYTDLNAHSNIIEKMIYGDAFLIKDSVRNIKWKITDETREIAGYQCRRANGIIMDSIYVVAFFTNKIPVFGGPESFTGLPGMIMSVFLPHENINWQATKVTEMQIPPQTIVPPKKGKVVTRKQLKTQLNSVMKNWGKEGPFEMRLFML